MRSFTFNSDPPLAWRRFFRLAVGTALSLGLAIYACIALIDPWDSLPLSPPWRRAQISHNARFSFPALARSNRFDSAVLGTSTSRLLRPEQLNALLGGAFANLAMNSATPYEQARLLEVFASLHPQARTVMVGVDFKWCQTGDTYEKYSILQFPEWMYERDLWSGYLNIFSVYAVQEAAMQFAYLTGLRKPRFGRDGYRYFLPDESEYDFARARKDLGDVGPAQDTEPEAVVDQPALHFASHALLAQALSALPARTQKLLFFTPVFLGNQPPPRTEDAAVWSACKFRIAALAKSIPNAMVVDFMIASPITREPTHYWDGLHYRIVVVDRLMGDLAEAARGHASQSGDYLLITR